MSGDPFKLPSEIKGTRYKEFGDFERSGYNGRPYVYLNGKSTLYSRVTTYIDCLCDRTLLEKWKARLILTGLAVEKPRHPLFRELLETDLSDRNALNDLADAAFKVGDGYLKASQGTDMHKLTEAWDKLEALPYYDDRESADFKAWLQLVDDHDLVPVDVERKVVIDELKCAGTPDRTYWYEGELVLGDLKTGATLSLDPGKHCMQMALYSRGQWYDPETHERAPMGVSQDVGLILHVPNGLGVASLHRADLREGWRGVQMARQVRAWRNESKKVLGQLSIPLEKLLGS